MPVIRAAVAIWRKAYWSVPDGQTGDFISRPFCRSALGGIRRFLDQATQAGRHGCFCGRLVLGGETLSPRKLRTTGRNEA
jgi:hypothetical protein